jgi:hypothetical protein
MPNARSFPRSLASWRAVFFPLAFALAFCAGGLTAAPTTENLVPEGAFASDRGRAQGWAPDNPKQAWLRDRFKVVEEAGRAFLRSDKSPAIIRVDKPIDPAWAELELRFESRRTGVVKGKNRWDVPSAEIDFIGADGQSLLDWRKALFLDGDAPAWTPVTRRYPVPAGAVTLVVRVANKAAAGTVDFANLSVVATAQRPAAEQAELREKLSAIEAEKEAAAARAEAERRAVQSADPSKITGARLDESAIQAVLHADAEAAPGGDGSASRPFASFRDALQAARASLRDLKPTKILLAPGTYREGEITLTGGTRNQPMNPEHETLLVIEGAKRGEVILSGSDLFPPAKWTPLKDASGKIVAYAHPWTHDFGFTEGPWGQYNPKDIRGHRAEMVFFNGRPLHQIILEDHEYIPGKGWSGKGRHNYRGFRDPLATLSPGSFGVAERDENGNRIIVRPPEGADWASATIEITTKRHVFHSHYKSGLVLRNLVFQHAASTHHTVSAALMIGHWHHDQQKLQNNDLLLDGVEVRWNNGFGVKIQRGKNVTIRDSRFHHNGHSGLNTGVLANTLIERCDFSFNNWRGHLGGLYGWAVAGAKLHQMRDCHVRDVTAFGNLAPGVWFDVNNTNCILERADLVANRRNIFLEISGGPFLVRDTLAAHDQRTGLVLTNAANVTVENSILYGADEPLVTVTANENRGAANTIEASLGIEEPIGKGLEIVGDAPKRVFRAGPTRFRQSVFVQPGAKAHLLRQVPSSRELYQDWAENLLGLEQTLFWSPSPKPFGVGYTDRVMGDWSAFRTFTGEGADSLWADPKFTAPDQLDFTLQPGSPVADWRLPARRLDPALRSRIEAFFRFWNYDGGLSYEDIPAN